jgi:hypothetical protein
MRFDLLLARRELTFAIARTQNPVILGKLQAAIAAIDQASILPPPPPSPPPFLGGVVIIAG